MKRLYLPFVFAAAIFLFVGCKPNDSILNPNIDTETTEVSDTSKDTLDEDKTQATKPTDIEYMPIEKYIWDKEKTNLSLTTLKLSSNWDEYIYVGDTRISSTQLTDVSSLSNYFFGRNSCHGNLETLYYVPTFQFLLISEKEPIGKYSTTTLTVCSTSSIVDSLKYNAIIEGIQTVAVTNPYECKFDELTSNAYNDGYFGIGSNYKDVINMIGKPDDSFSEPMDEGIKATTCVYVRDNAELICTYVWFEEDGVESGVISSINWIPITVRTALHTQDSMEKFVGFH